MSSSSLAAIIPILCVTAAGIAAMLAEALRQPGERMPISGLGFVGLAGAAITSALLWGRHAVSFGVVLADNFGLFISLVLVGVGFLTLLYSPQLVERDGLPAGEYYALTLFAIAGMMLMAMATDLLVIFLALEVLSLAVYVLTALRRDSSAGAEAAFKYFLLGALLQRVLPLRDRVRVRRERQHAAGPAGERAGLRRRAGTRRWRSSRSGSCSSGSPSRCRRCPSTCGRRTPTRAPRQSSRASCRRPSRRRRSRRSRASSCRRSSPLRATWAARAVGHRRGHDGRRHRRRGGADQPEANARLLEHRARRLHPRWRSSRPTT